MKTDDRIARLFGEQTFSRLFSIGAFLGLLFLFRHLWAVAVFFVAFERTFRFFAKHLAKVSKLKVKHARLAVVLGFVLSLALVVAVGAISGAKSGVQSWHQLREASPEWIGELRQHPLIQKIQAELGDGENVISHAKDYAGEAFRYVSAIGRFFLQAVLGFILAVVYLLEEVEIDEFESKIDPSSLAGRVMRWFGHVADAVSVTLQLQLIVAVFNSVTTVPVLLLLGIPHVLSLMALIFVAALVPVVGNLVVGVLLCLLAYQAKGWFGVGVFVCVTFLLHKIESYYLSPRLTSRHVRLPAFVLILSLVASEHVFGFAGIFLSFPALFVGSRIRAEFLRKREREAEGEAEPAVE
jgi:predicted PurR-regulated permease PerM